MLNLVAHFRGTVLVDADGKVQMWSINNMDAGRSPAEVLRTSQATMAGGLCGANWKKGRRIRWMKPLQVSHDGKR